MFHQQILGTHCVPGFRPGRAGTPPKQTRGLGREGPPARPALWLPFQRKCFLSGSWLAPPLALVSCSLPTAPSLYPFPHHKPRRLAESTQRAVHPYFYKEPARCFLEGQGEEEAVSRCASAQRAQTKERSSSSLPLGAVVNVSATCTDHLAGG